MHSVPRHPDGDRRFEDETAVCPRPLMLRTDIHPYHSITAYTTQRYTMEKWNNRASRDWAGMDRLQHGIRS